MDEKENQIKNEEIHKNEPVSQNAEIGKISGLLETLVSKITKMDEKMTKMDEKMTKMEKKIEELEKPIM